MSFGEVSWHNLRLMLECVRGSTENELLFLSAYMVAKM